MKKFILGLGTVASAIAPVAAVVACGDGSGNNSGGGTEEIIPNHLGPSGLSAVETNNIIKKFKDVLGVQLSHLSDDKDEFKIKFSSLNAKKIAFEITLNENLTNAINFANLALNGTPLQMAVGETLSITLEVGEDGISFSTKNIALSNSTDTTKNGAYSLTTSITDQQIIGFIKDTVLEVGINSDIKLASSDVQTISNKLKTMADSKEAIFGGDTKTLDLNTEGILKAVITPNKTFDFKLKLTTPENGLLLTGVDDIDRAKHQINSQKGEKIEIHLHGVMSNSGVPTLSIKRATSNSVAMRIHTQGAIELAKILFDIAINTGTNTLEKSNVEVTIPTFTNKESTAIISNLNDFLGIPSKFLTGSQNNFKFKLLSIDSRGLKFTIERVSVSDGGTNEQILFDCLSKAGSKLDFVQGSILTGNLRIDDKGKEISSSDERSEKLIDVFQLSHSSNDGIYPLTNITRDNIISIVRQFITHSIGTKTSFLLSASETQIIADKLHKMSTNESKIFKYGQHDSTKVLENTRLNAISTISPNGDFDFQLKVSYNDLLGAAITMYALDGSNAVQALELPRQHTATIHLIGNMDYKSTIKLTKKNLSFGTNEFTLDETGAKELVKILTYFSSTS